jgi:hypothetical protein
LDVSCIVRRHGTDAAFQSSSLYRLLALVGRSLCP